MRISTCPKQSGGKKGGSFPLMVSVPLDAVALEVLGCWVLGCSGIGVLGCSTAWVFRFWGVGVFRFRAAPERPARELPLVAAVALGVALVA
eukprot:9316611-Pyramimonas_sp.AAC.1